MHLRLWFMAVIVFAGALFCPPVRGQAPNPGIVIMPGSMSSANGGRSGRVRDRDGRSPLQRQLYKEERLKQIVSDTDRLLALAHELKAEIAQRMEDTVTPAMAKKLDEIEKLAQRVKQKERE